MICAPHRTGAAPRRLPAPPFQTPVHSSPGAGSRRSLEGRSRPPGCLTHSDLLCVLMDRQISLWEWIGAVPLGPEGWGFIRSNLYPLFPFPRSP